MMIVGVLLAGWLGWIFAGRALAPVGSLSHAVDALPVAPRPTQLHTMVGDDELGHLARAIDAYQARLVEADTRQLAFFADASHALRTPIAVVQGVAEVLLDARRFSRWMMRRRMQVRRSRHCWHLRKRSCCWAFRRVGMTARICTRSRNWRR
jgi:signal transduction histidine kinase